MVIVEDEGEPIREGRPELAVLAHEGRDDVLLLRAAGPEREDQLQRGRGEVGVELAAGGDEMAQEYEPVPVVRLEAVPGDPARRPRRPVREQGRLSETRLRHDERDTAGRGAV